MYLRLFAAAETDIDRTEPVAAMSALSSRLLDTTDLGHVMRRRRENFDVLADAFDHRVFGGIATPLFTQLALNASPLVFPIRVADGRRDRLRRALADRLVYCPVHWPLPAAVPVERFAEADALASEVLGLPIDQRYDRASMGRLVELIADAARVAHS
jgi:dTDP-4-amino-4,6-dideoxygalactose transaminase